MARHPDLFGGVYPDAPGYRDTDTSKDAADAIRPRLSAMQSNVLKALAVRPMTSFEIAHALRLPFHADQPRTAELQAKGMIEDSGERGISRDPTKLAIVWRLAQTESSPSSSKPGSGA